MQSPELLPVPPTYRPRFAEEARKLALARDSDEYPRYILRPELERLAAIACDDGARAGRRR